MVRKSKDKIKKGVDFIVERQELEPRVFRPGREFIGVTCVFYCHDGKGNLLLQKRSKNCKDEIGNWECGGGSLEHGESFEEAIKREVKEEYCCEALDVKFAGASNVLRKNGENKTHWIALIHSVLVDPKKVKIGEPEKIDEIGWFSLDNLPAPLHSMLLRHLEMAKTTGVFK